MYGFAWPPVNWGAFYAFMLLAIPALGLLVMQYPAYGALFLAGSAGHLRPAAWASRSRPSAFRDPDRVLRERDPARGRQPA